jgi:hypothetical protein
MQRLRQKLHGARRFAVTAHAEATPDIVVPCLGAECSRTAGRPHQRLP